MPEKSFSLYGVTHKQLQITAGLSALDNIFLNWLKEHHPEQAKFVHSLRNDESAWSEPDYDAWLMDFSPVLAGFLTQGLQIQSATQPFKVEASRERRLYTFTAEVEKQLRRQGKGEESPVLDEAWAALTHLAILSLPEPEYAIADYYLNAQSSGDDQACRLIEGLYRAVLANPDDARVTDWSWFYRSARIDHAELIPTDREKEEVGESRVSKPEDRRLREGFDLTDRGLSVSEQHFHANYCIYCHSKEGDFCTRGFPVKKGLPDAYRTHSTGELMLGCPLEEKISQMHALYALGEVIAALAVIMIHNPLCALTGHRICNDCMKSCIYQKKTPVNTPGVETAILKAVLALPYGVEIYALLMRWNPMRKTQFIQTPYNGRHVLVMGLGPAGISAAHHLLMEGCGVVGVDGLHIKKLPDALVSQPIKEVEQLWSDLSERPMRGFGGVAEYGITVRWDKNFLTLVQLILQRQSHFALYGDCRFGGTLSVPDAWTLGFDHLCLAVGAGLPRELRIPGSLAPGMRQANDFLMALHLTGAGRSHSHAALPLRLPVLVIGGGLTAVDTATEAQAYYVTQIQQIKCWYDAVTAVHGLGWVESQLEPYDLRCVQEWLAHARAWNEYAASTDQPDVSVFVKRYGGVSIVYRKRLEDSPAYRLNHEELQKALAEGLHYRECLSPEAAVLDDLGAVKAMRFLMVTHGENGYQNTEQSITLNAASVLCATGASPNVAYEFEHKGTFLKHNKMYRPHRFSGDHLILEEREEGHCKSPDVGMMTSYNDGEHRVSLLGDAHPWFHGSVVKAIASGQIAAPQIMASLSTAQSTQSFSHLTETLAAQWASQLSAVRQLTDTLAEWVVKAPWLASKHKPGQCYRIRSASTDLEYEQEPAALVGAAHPDDPESLVFWIPVSTLERHGLDEVSVSDELSLMGPTGAWSAIPAHHRHILVVGGELGAAYLLSHAQSWEAHGFTVGFLQIEGDWSHHSEFFASVGCQQANRTDESLDQALKAYGREESEKIDAIHVIGDADCLRQMQRLRHTVWKDLLPADVHWVGSTYGPMQCMLKGVCAQCLQWQVDPTTGKRTKAVYGCSWQHQPMDLIDIDHLESRQQLKSAHFALSELFRHLTGEWYE